MNRSRAAAIVFLFVSSTATFARADDQDATTAEALFVAGRDAMDRGDFAEACAKFAESDRLDPGAGTRINLAECKERLGQLATSWRHWREALDLLERDDGRRPLVVERIAAIEKRVPRLTIRLFGTVPGTRVTRDGVEIGPASLSLPLPVEPGDHVVKVTAPEREDTLMTTELLEGQRKTVNVTVGRKLNVPPESAAPPPTTSSLRYVGFGLGIAGGAILLAGGAFGLAAIGAKSDMGPNCFPATVCNPHGADIASRGRTFATLSTIGVIGGGVLLAGGVALVLTHPRAKSTGTVGLHFRADGIGAMGTF